MPQLLKNIQLHNHIFKLFIVTLLLTQLASTVITPVALGYTFNNRGYFNSANIGPGLHASVLPWMAGCSFAGFGGTAWTSWIAGNYSSNYMALPLNQSGGSGGNKTQFRDFLVNRYNNNGCSGWERMGVVFIVRTMLNDPVGSPMSLAASDWDRFNNLITNNPLITMSYDSTGITSSNNSGAGGYAGLGGARDDYFYSGSGAYTEPEYTFSGPGYTYRLKLRCANPTGVIGDTPPSPSTPAEFEPIVYVNGIHGGDVIVNPSDTARFLARNRVTDYGGENHTFTGLLQRTYKRGDGTWTGWVNIHQGTYIATANGDRVIWGETPTLGYPIGRGTTQGGSLRSPDPIPMDADVICYRLDMTAVDGATLSDRTTPSPLPSDPSKTTCMRFRGGTTTADATASPTYIEPGQSSTIRASIKTTDFNDWGSSASNYTVDCSYSIVITPGTGVGTDSGDIGLPLSGSCDRTITSDPATWDILVLNRTYTTTPTTKVGSKVCTTITLTPSDFVSSTSNTKTVCTTVVAKPVFQVIGGDVAAGGAIAAWPNAPTYNGAYTTLGAFSNGAITGFATAKVMAGGPPRTLTFANTDPASVTSDLYGGLYNGTLSPADHWNSQPTGMSNLGSGVGVFGNAATGSYTFNPGSINGPRTIAVGTQKTLYTNGDLRITGNITYNRTSPWGSPSQVPGIKFVVNGDIYIKDSVTVLDGIYIATGNIYTCVDVTGTIADPNDSGYYSLCDEPLRVNGIFSANKIHLLRTGGTARAGSPAERFYYLPELWQAQWPKDNATSGIKYDSITSLPPIL